MDVISLLNSLNPGTGTPATPQAEPNGTAAVAAAAAIAVASTSLAATNLAVANRGDDARSPGTALAASSTGGPAPANAVGAIPNVPLISGTADVYHAADAPATASLLAQHGVGAYVQLLNVLASGDLDARSAAQLVDNLGKASATLRSAYEDAVARLPAPLQQKDWAFSVVNDSLVFTQGDDKLSPQDFAALRQAFSGANVEPAARQLVMVMTTLELERNSAADPSSLAANRPGVAQTSLDDVNLRAYITSTAPGGKYTPAVMESIDYSRLPAILGGLNLAGLMSGRPDPSREKDPAMREALAAAAIPEKLEVSSALQGQCACGAVRFTVEDAFVYAFYCHCSRCRRRTGSAFAAIAGIGVDKVEVTSGRDHLLIEGECSDGYGARCSRCHAFLFAVVRGRQYTHVSLGALVSTPGRSPDHHIYVGSKAPWHQITDALPQYDELP